MPSSNERTGERYRRKLRQLEHLATLRNSNTPLQWYPTKYKFWPRVLPTPALALEQRTAIKTDQSKKDRKEIGTTWIYTKEQMRQSKLKRNRDRGKIAYPKARKIKSKFTIQRICSKGLTPYRSWQKHQGKERQKVTRSSHCIT